MSTKRLVVAAIIVDDLLDPSRVLAARRSRPADLAGRWEFPGGKVEPGEQPTDALKRELAEELQIAVTVGAELLDPQHESWPISSTFEMRSWWTKIIGGEPAPTDSHDEVRWMPIAALHELPWLPADVAIVDLIQTSSL